VATYDADLQGALLLVEPATNTASEAWLYKRGHWQRLDAAGPAPVTDDPLWAYDDELHEAVLVSGDQAWGFDGSRWGGVASPPKGVVLGMVYDAAVQKMVAVVMATNTRAETFAFDGSAWSLVQTKTALSDPAFPEGVSLVCETGCRRLHSGANRTSSLGISLGLRLAAGLWWLVV